MPTSLGVLNSSIIFFPSNICRPSRNFRKRNQPQPTYVPSREAQEMSSAMSGWVPRRRKSDAIFKYRRPSRSVVVARCLTASTRTLLPKTNLLSNVVGQKLRHRSEEHTSELQSL